MKAQEPIFKKQASDRETYIEGFNTNLNLKNSIRAKLPRSIDKDQPLRDIKKALPNSDTGILLDQFITTLVSRISSEADASATIKSAMNELKRQGLPPARLVEMERELCGWIEGGSITELTAEKLLQLAQEVRNGYTCEDSSGLVAAIEKYEKSQARLDQMKAELDSNKQYADMDGFGDKFAKTKSELERMENQGRALDEELSMLKAKAENLRRQISGELENLNRL